MSLARFHALFGGVMLALAILTLAVIAGGDRTEPTPRSVEPADGEQAVPASSSIVLRFSRPVDAATVASHVMIEPPVIGSWSVDRSLARFTPLAGLLPGASYTITVRTGLSDATGRTLRRDTASQFRTRAARLVLSRHQPGATDLLAPRNLWIATQDSASPRQVTREPLGVLFAAVAPDGERVAYSAPNPAAPNASSLWIVNLDGSGRQQLAGDVDGAILSLSWSPRGDLIAYERRSVLSARGELGRPSILAVRPTGGGGGLLFGRGDEAGSQPVWSPDGRRLLLADTAGRGRWIVDLTGDATLVAGGGTDSGTWSPDGQFIAFADLVQERDETRSVIRVARSDGVVVRSLKRRDFSDTAPAWSPDGRSIAVVGQHSDGESSIWLLDAEGGPARAIQPQGAWPVAQLTPPVWSSGGALLAFSRIDSVSGGGATWTVLVAPCEGASACVAPVDGLAEGWAP